jgi:hypothetical protein
MSKHNIPKLTGAALAIAAAGLVGCAGNGDHKSASTAAAATTDLVHCYGVNVCGGHNDCKTASNACAGHASCKGTGFVGMPAKACADVGGKQQDSWSGTIARADLIHCSGVNICGGHNDCKTANNACAGHASCKGTGFVGMPEKACKDIGGKVS